MALVHLAEPDADGTIELRTGDTVELRLPESPANGYRWRWRLPEGLRMIADEHVRAPVAAGGPGPGTVGERRLAFDVTREGLHEVRAELARLWEGESSRALTFLVRSR